MLDKSDLAWAAGLIDGEGCLYQYRHVPKISVAQAHQELLHRLRNMFGGNISLMRRAGIGLSRKDLYSWDLVGIRAVGVMMTLFHWLSAKRRGEIMKGLGLWRAAKPQQRYRLKCPKGHEYVTVIKRNGQKRRDCFECRRIVLAARPKKIRVCPNCKKEFPGSNEFRRCCSSECTKIFRTRCATERMRVYRRRKRELSEERATA